MQDLDIDPRTDVLVRMARAPEGPEAWDQGESYLSLPNGSKAEAIRLAAGQARQQVVLSIENLRQELRHPGASKQPPAEIQRRIQVLEALLARPVYVAPNVVDALKTPVTPAAVEKLLQQAKQEVVQGKEYLPIDAWSQENP